MITEIKKPAAKAIVRADMKALNVLQKIMSQARDFLESIAKRIRLLKPNPTATRPGASLNDRKVLCDVRFLAEGIFFKNKHFSTFIYDFFCKKRI